MNQISILKPIQQAFLNQPLTAVEQVVSQGNIVPILEQAEYPDTEHPDKYGNTSGMYLYYKGLKFPKRGFPYPEAIAAINEIKRVSMIPISISSKGFVLPAIGLLLSPWKWKIDLLEKILINYNRFSEPILYSHYLEERYYSDCARELWRFLYHFLMALGISPLVAYKAGINLATMIEYDDSYRYRIEDLMSETSEQLMLKDPVKEIKKIINLIPQRENNYSEIVHAGGKFIAIGKILSFILKIPKIKKAFKTAISAIDFTKLQLDEIDKYHCLSRGDYKFFGQSIDIRMDKFFYIHKDGVPQLYEVSLNKV